MAEEEKPQRVDTETVRVGKDGGVEVQREKFMDPDEQSTRVDRSEGSERR